MDNKVREIENEELGWLYSIYSEKKNIRYAYIIVLILIFLFISFIDKILTIFFGMCVPLYLSIKSLRERQREKIRDWCKYWIIFSIFLNFENFFFPFLVEIRLYFFYKVVFLLILFLPQYNGADYFYTNILKELFIKYEEDLCDVTRTLAEKLKKSFLEDQNENYQDDKNDEKDNQGLQDSK